MYKVIYFLFDAKQVETLKIHFIQTINAYKLWMRVTMRFLPLI